MNWSAFEVADTPPIVVTVTSNSPAEPAGSNAVISVADTTVTFVAAFEPNWTVAPLTKFVPVMVTVVPPDVEPEDGLTPVTVGAGVV